MTTPITQLPTPPQPSDSPVDFDQKAFALLGGLPQFVNEANTLGGQITALGENSTESAAAALASKNAAATSASNSAGSATASGQSASNSASSANAANQSRIDAQNAADAAAASAESVDTAYLRNRANHTGAQAIDTVEGLQSALDSKADSTTVAQAIAMAATFTAVPTTFQAAIVVVTQPHLRCMWWNGTKYVRAPWHRACDVFYSYDNPSTISGALPVRGDVSYQQSNYPDVIERLGLSGSGTFTLVEARGEFIRVLDNGRAVDASRVLRSAQGDAGRNLTAYFEGRTTGSTAAIFGNPAGAAQGQYSSLDGQITGVTGAISADRFIAISIDASRVWPTAPEFRPRNIAFPLWMTY